MDQIQYEWQYINQKIKLILTSKFSSHWSSPCMIIWMIENWFNNNRRMSIGCMNIVDIVKDFRCTYNRKINCICGTTNHDDRCTTKLKINFIPSWIRRTIIENSENGEKLTNWKLIEMELINYKFVTNFYL